MDDAKKDDARKGSAVPPVVVDAMGGDHAPAEPVAGALTAVREHGVPVVLVGKATQVKEELKRHGGLGEVPVVHAEEALAMHEGALAGWRRPRSSIAVACWLVRRRAAGALVSAGSTGGVVATARLRLRGQQGVLRPAIAAVLPTRPRPTVVLDVGATADVKPEMLVQFAALGSAYAQIAFGVDRPRVGLLTIGGEPGKGNKLARRAQELFADNPDFAGNVEGNELLDGRVDVIVTDGFTGNILLKGIEGASSRQRTGPTEQGAALLGVAGTVVVCHGSADGPDIASGIALAARLHREGVIPAVAGLADDLLTELSSAGGLTIRDALGERS
jgi:phosphate acyltransferase